MFNYPLWHLALVAGAGFPGLGVSSHCTKPPLLCGIPPFDYQNLSQSRTESAVSMIAIEIRAEQRPPFDLGTLPRGVVVSQPVVIRERVRIYQLQQSVLRIDHCSLSRFALTLHEDGSWTLNFQADQNPQMIGQPLNAITAPGAAALDIGGKQTTHLKRNEFNVRVRCYGAFPINQLLTDAPGKPVLFEIRPQPFWVQRGQPYSFWERHPDPLVARYFDLIDRVEVEFFYR